MTEITHKLKGQSIVEMALLLPLMLLLFFWHHRHGLHDLQLRDGVPVGPRSR
ncbi:MAG: hypothetical protein HC914_01935 [Chloroflexaceae bacterium]|nr:hypothetical protein [Chloroflexaceae bacterium]